VEVQLRNMCKLYSLEFTAWSSCWCRTI